MIVKGEEFIVFELDDFVCDVKVCYCLGGLLEDQVGGEVEDEVECCYCVWVCGDEWCVFDCEQEGWQEEQCIGQCGEVVGQGGDVFGGIGLLCEDFGDEEDQDLWVEQYVQWEQ